MKMDIIKELNLLIQMHYSGDIDSRDEWLREIIYLKSRFESKVNNGVLDDVSKPLAPKEVKNCMKADLKLGSVCKEHCGASWC